jgi:hypothetical protein
MMFESPTLAVMFFVKNVLDDGEMLCHNKQQMSRKIIRAGENSFRRSQRWLEIDP